MQWSWLALPGLAAFALALLVGGFVYFARPERAQNRWLGLFIVLESLYLFSWTAGRFLFESQRGYHAMLAVGIISATVALAPYLLFLATLDSPLARPLRSRLAHWALALYAVYGVASWYLAPGFFHSFERVDGMWTEESGLLDVINTGLLPLLAFLYGFVVAVSAWRRAKRGSASRERARAYAVAFGFRDAAFVLTITGFALARDVWGSDHVTLDLVSATTIPFVQLVYLPMLVYGIAKTHLFDIDLKIKWTLRRGTVAGAFLAVFLVASVTAENFLTNRYGWAVGGVTAGLLLFVIAPLQRGADRLAERAMPGVNDTSEYEAFRKLSVYRAAVESAYEVGGVSTKERSILERMRQKLGVLPGDAGRIEAEFGAIRAR